MLLGYLMPCQRFKVTFLHCSFNSVLDWLHLLFYLVVQANQLQMDFVQHDKTSNHDLREHVHEDGSQARMIVDARFDIAEDDLDLI